MTVALQSSDLVSALIPVDNAPVNAPLKSDFGKYVRGMQEVEAQGVTKQSDADKILKEYEEVSFSLLCSDWVLGQSSKSSKTHTNCTVPPHPSISLDQPSSRGRWSEDEIPYPFIGAGTGYSCYG